MKKYSLILVITVLFTSCFNSKFFANTTNKFEPYNGIVAVLYQTPKVEYETIGQVSVQGEDVSLGEVFEGLQRKTAEIGGNAVIVQKKQIFSSDTGTVPQGAGELTLNADKSNEVVGTAILLKE